ncbi:MAG: hypothetical protein UY52_C0010G0014 [Parcubacteria group bacterium GW2011_GWC2_49_9]|nr:MAG: hypothetical protein UY34_C0005G0027 [Parcubacteria group bacterium GW2011_GWA2_48_9]KKW16111.1 MAG: hypothetical protein UY52_C0010G0014 [Parcubacteria group bacterium GW2011_GWC2_49_9]
MADVTYLGSNDGWREQGYGGCTDDGADNYTDFLHEFIFYNIS